jgi:uncharacterized integral membrane protein
MQIISKILSLALFILFMGFAIKNAYPVTLLYYLGLSWQAPLSLILFIALLIGIVAGLVAISPTIIKQRRELNSLRKKVTSSSHQGAQ